MKAEIMYATMKPWKLFFKVAFPSMISMFAMSIYSIIEGIFIGQKLGEGAFAAVNIAIPLVMINFSLADLIGVGASVPISIALGRKDHRTANNVFSGSIILIILSAIFMGSIMFLAAEPLSRMMGADDTLLTNSVKYLRTFALCSPLTTIFFAMDNYLRICGYIKTSMAINICSNILTVALLALFLFVFEMDVVGSAIATSISMCVSSLLCWIPFLSQKTLLQFTKPKFNKHMLQEILACGSPVFLSNITGRLTSIVMNISLMTLGAKILGENGGATAVAAYAVLMYACDLCWPLLYGISDSLSPAIGYNWGAENFTRVKKILKTAYIGTSVVGLITTSILFFLPNTLASLFAKAEDVELLSLAAKAIRMFSFTYLFRWFVVTTQSFLTAIEKPFLATAMSVAIALVFPIALLGILWPLGLNGIWLNFPGVNILGTALGVVLLWRILRKIKTQSTEQAHIP